jgi:hypothetical protein
MPTWTRPLSYEVARVCQNPRAIILKWSKNGDSFMAVTGIGVPEVVQRLQGMFLDVLGTQLSVPDAARLSGVEPSLCQNILEALVAAQFLSRGRNGTFTLRGSDR